MLPYKEIILVDLQSNSSLIRENDDIKNGTCKKAIPNQALKFDLPVHKSIYLDS